MTGYIPDTNARKVGIWLALCALMVFMMMQIGAITRLTESGLSMAEWRPLIGWIPPMTDAEWARIFDLYQGTSQYSLANSGMSVEEFKTIFWWEYIHRVWGRTIGLVFALPFFWFLLRRQIPSGLGRHLAALLGLGAVQGVIGWWMVKSGFVDRTDVSQYRLAVHLGMAFFILGYLVWVSVFLLKPVEQARAAVSRGFRRLGAMAHAIIFFTVLSGALVAGLNAGFAYNDWPFMNGNFIPENYFWLKPWWLNFFETIQAVQFNHRTFAYATAAVVASLWLWSRKKDLAPRARLSINALATMLVIQLSLGISTLMLVVPTPLAVAHQAGAALTFVISLWVMIELRGHRKSVFRD